MEYIARALGLWISGLGIFSVSISAFLHPVQAHSNLIGVANPRRLVFMVFENPRLPLASSLLIIPLMIAEVRKLLEGRPFEPFSIVTSAGIRYRVASPDHADLNPPNSRVLVWFDDGTGVVVSGLHIAAVELEKPQAA